MALMVASTRPRRRRRERTRSAEQAALPGCRANCAKLLTDAKEAAKTKLDNARAALAALPKNASSVSLADNLGFSWWAWDLFMASLRGLAIIGGSIAETSPASRRKAEAGTLASLP